MPRPRAPGSPRCVCVCVFYLASYRTKRGYGAQWRGSPPPSAHSNANNPPTGYERCSIRHFRTLHDDNNAQLGPRTSRDADSRPHRAPGAPLIPRIVNARLCVHADVLHTHTYTTKETRKRGYASVSFFFLLVAASGRRAALRL